MKKFLFMLAGILWVSASIAARADDAANNNAGIANTTAPATVDATPTTTGMANNADVITPPVSHAARSGWYAGAALGASYTNDGCEHFGGRGHRGDDACEDTDAAGKLFGGYRLNRYLGIEGGYTYLGGISTDDDDWHHHDHNPDVRSRTQGWEADAVLALPVAERVSVYAKVGAFGWYRRDTVSFYSPYGRFTFHRDDNGVDVTAGIGADVRITQHIGVRGEWQYYKVSKTDMEAADVAFVYSF